MITQIHIGHPFLLAGFSVTEPYNFYAVLVLVPTSYFPLNSAGSGSLYNFKEILILKSLSPLNIYFSVWKQVDSNLGLFILFSYPDSF